MCFPLFLRFALFLFPLLRGFSFLRITMLWNWARRVNRGMYYPAYLNIILVFSIKLFPMFEALAARMRYRVLGTRAMISQGAYLKLFLGHSSCIMGSVCLEASSTESARGINTNTARSGS